MPSPEFYRALQSRINVLTPEEFQGLITQVDDRKEFDNAFKNRAYSCSADEFKSMLKKFGKDEGVLNALQQAVDARSKVEDRGNAWENGTPGWDTYAKKSNMIDDYRLGLGEFKGTFTQAAKKEEPAKDQPSYLELAHQVAAITRRIEKLEGKNKPSPQGPGNV